MLQYRGMSTLRALSGFSDPLSFHCKEKLHAGLNFERRSWVSSHEETRIWETKGDKKSF